MPETNRRERFARYPSLKDRVVFISGGSSGIGESLVESFCAQESKVAFVDVLAEEGRALSERLAGIGLREPLFIECDVRDISNLQSAVETTRTRLGLITVLVNNAANDTRHQAEDVTPEFWDERMAVNLRHFFFAAQAVHPQMKDAGGGSIINFGSVSWMLTQGNMPAYTTAKAAVHGLTRTLARDYGPDGIRVNTVVPGWVMTKRQVELWLNEEAEGLLLERQCLKAKITPADLARMVLFLAADDSAMCTANNYFVDAGWV